MPSFARPPVVVGIDGSDTSLVAVEWAVAEAARRSLPVHVLHAWSVAVPPVAMGPALMNVDDEPLRVAAQSVLDSAVAAAHAADSTVEVIGELKPGPPSLHLLEAAEGAQVLVVGASGLGGFSEFFLGSITTQVVAHSSAPVVVVREPEKDISPGPDAGRVVVGIDGSTLSVDAAKAAFEAASIRGVGLTLLHVWNFPAYDSSGLVVPSTLILEETQEEELRAMAETVAGLREEFPDVTVEQRLSPGHPAKVLADSSRGAELVVVGSRGRGGFARLLLGSTSNALLHRAHCPVLVVRPGLD